MIGTQLKDKIGKGMRSEGERVTILYKTVKEVPQ
jgi:hypothetical protein